MSVSNSLKDGRGLPDNTPQLERPESCETANPQEAKISVFSHNRERIPSGVTSILRFALDTRHGKYRKLIERIRECVARGDDEGADRIKGSLPAVSISGLVTEGARASAFNDRRFRHSGYLQGDFDTKDFQPRRANDVKEVLSGDPHVQAAFFSAKGGVKTIIHIPICNSQEEHKNAFWAAESYFRLKYDLVLDPSTKDPVRLCYVSYDPEAHINAYPALVIPFITDENETLSNARNASAISGSPDLARKDKGIKASDLSIDEIKEMLGCIPPRPDYETWIRISSAVWAATGDEELGTKLLKEWSPEESEGEYSEKYKSRLSEIGPGTLVHFARENGYEYSARNKDSTEIKIPEDVFPIPTGEIDYRISGEKIFSTIAPFHQLFVRGRSVHEVVSGKDEPAFLAPVSAKRFCSLLERFGHRVARREWQESRGGDEKGKFIWRSARMPIKTSEILLLADPALEKLSPVRQLAACPILTKEGKVIECGYDPHAGGTYITQGSTPPEIPLEAAIEALLRLLDDFDFVTLADKSRAVASILSPALKMGDWVKEDFPMDVAEADRSQSGKTYRQNLVCQIYNESPVSITSPRGGVGSLDETISAALIKGRPFIMLDNFRGKLDSTILEQAIRGAGRVSCRALRVSADVDTRPFNWQLSTNGAEFTRDIANRSIITRIRKRDANYNFKEYDEGSLLSHVAAQQPFYLGAVFAIIREWARKGTPKTPETRHDFRAWCQSLDWIVQEIFKLAPLLDGHREEQARTANPALQWLREVALAARASGLLGQEFITSQLVSIAEDAGIDFPGNSLSREEPHQRAGKLLGRVFRESEERPVVVDGISVSRDIRSIHVAGRGYEDQKVYVFNSTDEGESRRPAVQQ